MSEAIKPVTRIGGGVQKSEAPPGVTEDGQPPVVETEEIDEAEAFEHGDWQDKPTLVNQFTKFPNTSRVLPPQYACFSVGGPDSDTQLKSLNELMARSGNLHESPRIIVEHEQRECVDGIYKILVKYRPIQYKKLVPKEIS